MDSFIKEGEQMLEGQQNQAAAGQQTAPVVATQQTTTTSFMGGAVQAGEDGAINTGKFTQMMESEERGSNFVSQDSTLS
jgi:hypothetical protein